MNKSHSKSHNILEQIKDCGIKPKSRWHFFFTNALMILILIASFVTAGLVMGIFFLKVFNLDWDLVDLWGNPNKPGILEVFPFFWIIFLIIVLAISILIFEKSESGYKYSPIFVLLGTIMISAIIGGLFYQFQGADYIDESLRTGVPFYKFIEEQREQHFHLPERGILPGRIIQVDAPDHLQIKDLRQNQWNIKVLPPASVKIRILQLQPGQPVMIIGEFIQPGEFAAKDIKLKRMMGPRNFLK